MNWNVVLDEVITGLQPENVPPEYLIMAKIMDRYGTETILRGEALAAFMAHPEKANVMEARVVLDVRKIKKSMNLDITHFFDELASKSINED